MASDALNFWKPHLLYLQNQQCQNLCVEINAVKGCEPDPNTLNELRHFLESHCDKKEIQLIQNPPIPTEKTHKSRPELIVLESLNTETFANTPQDTAYLHILFYDSEQLKRKHGKSINPHVQILPYPCAIYMDMKYIHKHGLSKHVPDLLKHEVGHILGLTWSRDEFCHCTDKSCLMHRYYDASSLKDHEQKHLCPDCQANLAKAQSDVPDSRLSFLGPVMVRSEEDYQVLSLPGFVKIHFGTLDTVHWQDVVCEAQKQVPRHAPMSGRVAILVGAPKNQIHNRVQLVQAIENAKQDPCSTVRLGITAITRRTMLVPPVSQKDQLASNLD